MMNIPENDKKKINPDDMVIYPDTISHILEETSRMSPQSLQYSHYEHLVSVSETIINFEQCLIGKEITKRIIITNNCGVDIFLKWEEGNYIKFSFFLSKFIHLYHCQAGFYYYAENLIC